MSAEKNKAVILRLFEEVYNGHDLDVLDELVAEDVVNHSATDEHKHGLEGFRHVMEWGAALMPDGRYELLDTIAEGDMVACRVRVSGTMRGSCSAFLRPARASWRSTCTGTACRAASWRSGGR